MKSASNSKVLASKLVVAILFFSSFSFLGGPTPTVSAATVTQTKDFSIGQGANRTSHSREFAVPVRAPITVKVRHQRNAQAGVADFNITVDLRDPNNNQVASKTVATTGGPTETVLTAPINANPGCSPKFWEVRVRSTAPELGTVQVTGNITFSFDASKLNLNVEGGLIDVNRGNQVVKTIFNIDKRCGTVVVKGTWDTEGIPGLDSAKLKFFLLRPNGSVARQLEANGANALQNPKMNFTYTLTQADGETGGGDWKLKIVNDSNFNARKINVTGTYTPGCN